MKHNALRAGALTFVLGAAAFWATRQTTQECEVAVLQDSGRMAASYLANHSGDDGRFTYAINIGGSEPRGKYNVVRHAGAIYGLAQYYALTQDEEARDAIVRSGRYLRQRYVRGVADLDGVAAVFSRPDEERSDTGFPEAKLGGTALAILALGEAQKLDPTVVTDAELERLGKFILFMQQDSGKFRSKYVEQVRFAADFDSVYYPGEAILALVSLYVKDGNQMWLLSAVKGIAYLVASRRNLLKLPNDHWLMIAVERLLVAYDLGESQKSIVVEHVADLGRTMIEEQRDAFRMGGLDGSFVPDGRSTPTATRLEGLLALQSILLREDAYPDLQQEVNKSIAMGIQFLLRCQVQDGRGRGGFLRALQKTSIADRSFKRRQTEIRIDYVQHALSALVRRAEMCLVQQQR